MRFRVRSLASLSGLRIRCCRECGVGCRCGLDSTLLWLWFRLAAMAPIWPLAWESPHAAGVALEKTKKKKRRKDKKPKSQKKKKKKREKLKISWITQSWFKNKVVACFSFTTQVRTGSASPKDYSTPLCYGKLQGSLLGNISGKEKS